MLSIAGRNCCPFISYRLFYLIDSCNFNSLFELGCSLFKYNSDKYVFKEMSKHYCSLVVTEAFPMLLEKAALVFATGYNKEWMNG